MFLFKAYKDLLKNKDLIDYYGDDPLLFDEKQQQQQQSSTSEGQSSSNSKLDGSLASLSSLSLATLGLGGIMSKQNSKERSESKDNLYTVDDEGLLDENLLQDIS